jgi:hypothetical protein
MLGSSVTWHRQISSGCLPWAGQTSLYRQQIRGINMGKCCILTKNHRDISMIKTNSAKHIQGKVQHTTMKR